MVSFVFLTSETLGFTILYTPRYDSKERVKREIAEAFLAVLVQAGVIKKDKE